MKILVLSKSDCPWCDRAVMELIERNLRFSLISVETVTGRTLFQRYADGQNTVPQIVLVDEVNPDAFVRVGGHDDLMSVIDTPRFQQKIGGH